MIKNFCNTCGVVFQGRGARCSACNVPRVRVSAPDNGFCASCSGYFDGSSLEVDHIRPRSWGGAESVANLQLLCKQCHRVKSLAER